jgi:protein TonB
MKTMLAFCIVLLGFSNLNSIIAQATDETNQVFTIVQHKPVFPGDINKWLGENIKYPDDAKKNNIQGTVYVEFIVEKDGSTSNVKVLRGVNKLLDDESVRVMSTMPKWTPGEQNGHSVRVEYMVPIKFTLANSNNSNSSNPWK